MRAKRVPTAALVVVVSAVIGGLLGGHLTASDDRTALRYREYTAALALVENSYAEPVDSAQVVYGSIDGMLRTLDPHSSFFDPKSYALMREQQQGHYYGIGVTIAQANNGDVTVTKVFEESPSWRGGLRRGDVIATVGKESAKGWTTDEVVKHIKGPKGTTVDVGIKRPGVTGPFTVTVERDEIAITTVHAAFMLAPGTGYIRMQGFSETTDDEMQAALKKLAGQGMQRLLLDLRENPGGPLDQAIAVATEFLKKNQMVVYTRGRAQNSDADYRTERTGDYTTEPLIVLVDRDTASAAEIVSGSMQDHDRGLIVGETTFGKALVQSVYNISENAGLAVTTAHYFTPSGRVIQRPWDANFDEYLTYTLRDQTGNRPHPESELHHTDAGRPVYGGGGIEPDFFVAGLIEGFTPSLFSRALYSRGAFVTFAQHFAIDGDARPGAKSGAIYKVKPGWDVTDAMVAAFKHDLESERVRIDEAGFVKDQAFIKAIIHYEVDVDLFGDNEARQRLVPIDPQIHAALPHFDEAKALLDKKTH